MLDMSSCEGRRGSLDSLKEVVFRVEGHPRFDVINERCLFADFLGHCNA